MFILPPLPVKGLFHGVRVPYGLGFMCLFYQLTAQSWITEASWKCAVFGHLLILASLSHDLFQDILRGHNFSLVQGSKQIHKRTWCAQKLQKWAYLINDPVGIPGESEDQGLDRVCIFEFYPYES